jgi:hypothetical protein
LIVARFLIQLSVDERRLTAADFPRGYACSIGLPSLEASLSRARIAVLSCNDRLTHMPSATIEAPLGDLRWPRACCRCGSGEFRLRRHTENVVTWTAIAVTAYRKITVQIPVCARCAWRRSLWYGSAAALTAATLMVGSTLDTTTYGGVLIGALLMVAVGMVLLGLNGQPLRLLKFDAATQVLTLRVYASGTAEALLTAPGAGRGIYKAVRPWYLIALVGTIVVAGLVAFVSLKTRQ